ARARSPQGLVCCSGHKIDVGHGRGMQICGYKPGYVGYVSHHMSVHRAADLAYALEIDAARVGARAADYHLRPVFLGKSCQRVIIDRLSLRIYTISDYLKIFAREVEWVTM